MPFLPASNTDQIPESQSNATHAWDSLSSAQKVQSYVNAGYTITQDGMSGTQLIAPRKMRGLDMAILILGGIMLFTPAMPLGVLFVAMALIDYYVIVKRPTVFVPRG